MERIVGYVFWAFFILFAAYIGIAIAPVEFLPSIDRERLISANISVVAQEAWSFAKPLLQLTFIVLIVSSVLQKVGERFTFLRTIQIGDVKSVLALLIVVSFCLAALSGSPTTGFLENIALVVVGFYFGSYTKDTLGIKAEGEKNYEHNLPAPDLNDNDQGR